MVEPIRERGLTNRPPTALREDAVRALRRPAGPGLPHEEGPARAEVRRAATRAGIGAENRRETTALASRRAEGRAQSRADNQQRPPRSRVTPDNTGRVIDIFA